MNLGFGLGFQKGLARLTFERPSGFSAWDYTSSFGITSVGRRYSTDFDATDYIPTGTVMYVDPVNGNNSNDGSTWALAKASVKGATDAGASVVYVAAGYYSTGDVMNVTNLALARDVAIICPTGRAYFTTSNARASYSWAQEGSPNTSVYAEAGYNPVEAVIDLTNLDSEGYPIPLIERTSVAECQSNPNSWFRNATALYVHTFDSRAPQNAAWDILGLRGNIVNLNITGNFDLYLENISLWGGDGALKYITTNGTAANIVTKNCHFMYSNASGKQITNALFTADVNGVAKYNKLDGFSINGGTTETRALWVDCRSTRNGLDTDFGATGDDYDNNCNSFTTHNSTAAIILNGHGDLTDGPIIAIANSSQCLALGTYAGESLATTQGSAGNDVSFKVNAGCYMAMENCRSGASYYGRQNTGTLVDLGGYIDGSTNGDDGTITPG